MEYYIREEGISFSTSIGEQFGDVQVAASLIQLTKERASLAQSIKPGGSIFCPPALYEDKLYFGACDKNFYCLNLNGEELWRFGTGNVITNFPIVRGGVMYGGSHDGVLYALDADTGELRWKFATNGPIFYMGAVTDDAVFVCSGDGNLYCLDLNGKEKWRFTTGGSTYSVVIVYGDAVYFGSFDNNFYCVGLDGRVRWKFTTHNMVASFPPIVKDGTAYFGSWDRNFYAVDAVTGELRWKFTAKDTTYPSAMEGGTVLFGSRDQLLYAVDAKTGKEKWRFKAKGTMVGGGATVHNGVIYFGAWDNNFYAVDMKTGRKAWSFPTNGPIINGGSVVHGGRVYFSSWDCHVYCLTLDGQSVWKFATSVSSQSDIEPEEKQGAVKSATITWSPVTEGEEKKYRKGEVDIADYGTFSGNYINVGKSDYMGERKKGYLK